jgi:ATP-dependent exoDNAse (exonuclease V) beta subunit
MVQPPRSPTFRSKDSVLNRPDGDPARHTTVSPGLHTFDGGAGRSHEVVWWDPSLLPLGITSSFGLRRDDLIVKDGDMFAVEDRLADYQRWRAGRAQLVAQGRLPSVRVQTATAWAAEAASAGVDEVIAASADIQVVAIPGAEGRPRGPRFGSLVHAVLAIVPLEASEESVRRAADVQGRLFSPPATSTEVAAAVDVVRAVFAHDLMARARASSRLRRETPITWTLPDGTLIEGVLDLAFDEDGGTTVIDFKTDHELAAGEARYRAQVQKYVDAVAAATGQPARGVLFKI